MRSVSTAFADAIAESHVISTRIDVLRDGEQIGDSIVSAISGTVDLDITAATRGTVNLTIADDGTLGLVPIEPTDPLAPYGNEIRVWRGISYLVGGEHDPGPGGSSYPGIYPGKPSSADAELVSLGIFRIDVAEVTDTPTGGLLIDISGRDRSCRIIDARFEDAYQVAAGTNYVTAIQDVILAGDPSVTFDLTATTLVTPQLLANEGDDRWKFAQDMATSLGHVLYFDGDGVCVSRPIAQTGATAPAFQFSEGDNGLLLTASRKWTRESTFNRVIATGENTGEGEPVRGVATDNNPLSPTYYYGPFGRVPRFYASPFVTTADQAADAASGILARELGTTQQVNFGTIVNPAIEPNDVCRITRAASGIDEDHVIDAVTIPLDVASPMSGRTRAVTT